MAMCAVCKSEIPVYERRCQSCGAGVVRDANSLLANAPTDKELSQARLVSPAGVPGMLILGGSLLRCTWNVRTFRTGAAKPNYPVRVLASTTEVPVCTGPCSRGAQLPAAVDTCNIRGVVCSTWLRRSALLGIYACLCGVSGMSWYSIGPDCLEGCGERGRRQVSY